METLMKTLGLVATLALAAQTAPHPEEPSLSGRSLEGYESAVAYLRKIFAKTRPFALSNYDVTFESGYRYYFQAKAGPHNKDWPGLTTDLGTTVRVYVDAKTLKVVKAVVE